MRVKPEPLDARFTSALCIRNPIYSFAFIHVRSPPRRQDVDKRRATQRHTRFLCFPDRGCPRVVVVVRKHRVRHDSVAGVVACIIRPRAATYSTGVEKETASIWELSCTLQDLPNGSDLDSRRHWILSRGSLAAATKIRSVHPGVDGRDCCPRWRSS